MYALPWSTVSRTVLSIETCSLWGTQLCVWSVTAVSQRRKCSMLKKCRPARKSMGKEGMTHLHNSHEVLWCLLIRQALIRFRQIHNEILLDLVQWIVSFDMIWPEIQYIVYISSKGKAKNFSFTPMWPHFLLGEGETRKILVICLLI